MKTASVRSSQASPRAVNLARERIETARSTPHATRRRIRPETRAQLLERLTNPQISLHEASVILRVCPATVRNYCNSGYLPHARTPGGQRRFRLNEVLAFAHLR